VVTDNDGDVAGLKKKYQDYLNCKGIRICYDEDESCSTLEPQLLKANSLQVLNTILETKHGTDSELTEYMKKNKTDCALKIFNSSLPIKFPQYIEDAIS
jgi:hypothetical protein